MIDLPSRLTQKIKWLNESVWEHKLDEPDIEYWLANFAAAQTGTPDERLRALYILSNFMFFSNRHVRELLRALYRDLYQYPIVEQIRRKKADTTDLAVIEPLFQGELERTRFLGVGNPSESGSHLLYYFRQENALPKKPFINTHEIFARKLKGKGRALRNGDIKRYIFIDDFCGSGDQGLEYSADIVEEIKALNRKAFVAYYVLFAASEGIDRIRNESAFDDAACICELDPSFRCFSDKSRYFANAPKEIDPAFAKDLCTRYGDALFPYDPLGYDDGQLLIGFHHNIPDNTLPIIWSDGNAATPWRPIFRRYPKVLEW